MNSIATNKDMALKNRIFRYTSPKNIPLSFCYGGRLIHGIPDDFDVSVLFRRADANIITREITASNGKGLLIRVNYLEYLDYAATEWSASFENTGSENTDILSDIRIGGIIGGKNPVLYHGNGDTTGYDGYEWYQTPVTEKIEKCTRDSTSCNGAFPYMRLINDDFGVNIAVGFTGKWCAEIDKAEGGALFSAGQKRCHMRLYPGEKIITPRIDFVAFEGDERRGANMWRRWYFTHILPRENGSPVPPLLCMHLFEEDGFPEFTGSTSKGQINAIDCYLKNGIHPDLWWMDAGWYPCDHNWYTNVGNWTVDSERYPDGFAPLGKKCEKENIRFMVWFEPERAYNDSELYIQHPEWLLSFKNDDGNENANHLVNLGNRECCDYIINTVDNIIKEGHIKIYRQDFNFNAEPVFTQNEADDRIGALENFHIQGYYRYWDALMERNPGLYIDSCAGGGRRNDLETMRRAVTFHYTDVGYGNHPIKQKQHRLMFDWIPYFRAHNMNWDNPETGEYDGKIKPPVDKYAYYVALTPALTDMTRFDASEDAFKIAREMQPIWRRAASLMLSCDYYPLTECRKSTEDFYAMAFYSPENGNGFFEVVSNKDNKQTEFTVKLPMLDLNEDYTVTEAESGNEIPMSGKQLASGMTVSLPKRSGVIYFITRV